MASKNLRRRALKARETEFSVKVCGTVSIRAILGHGLFALITLAAGASCLINERFIVASLLFLWFAMHVNAFRELKSDIGRTVVDFRKDGLKCRDRFLAWDNIKGVELHGERIDILSHDKQRVDLSRGPYDRTLEEVQSEIEKRIRI